MTPSPFTAFDADNHYYEAEDAFTRHADPKLANRAVQWVEMNGKRRLLVGGRINRFIANPTFDPIARPGCLDDYHRGRHKVEAIRDAFGELEPIRPEYRDRDARLAVMDAQGLEAAFLFPTLGVGLETSLVHDIEALQHTLRAFNRWLDEDWGFHYQERIFAAPMISLSDPDAAVAELEWALGRGARIVCLRMAPVTTALGTRSPGDTMFDPFWRLIGEARAVVAFHTGDSGYTKQTDDWEPFGNFRSFQFTPFRLLSSDRPVIDTMGALICHGVFERVPDVRVASIENGASWVAPLLKKLEKVHRTHSHEFAEDPVDTFRRHVYVSPFQEEDVDGFVDLMGAERVLFGSDFPHAEGLAEPMSYLNELANRDENEVRRIMCDNAWELVGRSTPPRRRS